MRELDIPSSAERDPDSLDPIGRLSPEEEEGHPTAQEIVDAHEIERLVEAER